LDFLGKLDKWQRRWFTPLQLPPARGRVGIRNPASTRWMLERMLACLLVGILRMGIRSMLGKMHDSH